jgi:hypothetical protein
VRNGRWLCAHCLEYDFATQAPAKYWELFRGPAAGECEPPLETHWEAVSARRESARYNPGITEQQARGLYFACTARRYGILAWLKNRW